MFESSHSTKPHAMPKISTKLSTYFSLKSLSLFLFLLSTISVVGQTACPGYPSMRQNKVSGISIGNAASPRFKGLLEFTPAGYNPADVNTLYPVIIYFHGLGAAGQGTSSDLCTILSDQTNSLPGRIESGTFQEVVNSGGIDYKFIVISPQYVQYDYGNNNYPSANAVDSVIDYVIANYRVNINRIYLTGMSTGANMVVEYAGNSLARAQRIAGASTASVCSVVGRTPNTNSAPTNIGNASLPFTFIQCEDDSYSCFPDIPQTWYNGILAANPSAGTFTTFKSLIKIPAVLPPVWPPANINDYCMPWGHDTWSLLYNQSYKINGKNLSEFFITYQRNINLPVKLTDYSARLVNNKVYLNWTTSREVDAASFIIERAGANQQFTELTSVRAAGNAITDKSYSVVDDRPVQGINYYRLVQVDADNNKHIHETRKVLNEKVLLKVKVLPNPVSSEVTAYITLSRPQQVSVTITDMSGKVLQMKAGYYKEGSSGISLPTESLASGIYLLRTNGEDFSDIQKIVKQ